MVTIGMNYTVRSGKEAVFEAAFQRVLEAMGGIAGHAESHLYREVGVGARGYLIVSRWSDEDAFRAFIRSERFRKVADWGAENILEGPPRHTTYRES
jgi:heme-degrading monooxygenase HmoA